jgi:hypothetical protein
MTDIEVVKAATCPSLSGKSTLSYELGRDAAGRAQLRIVSNTGSGMFSDSWVAWDDVAELLHAQGEKPVTSHSLHPICKGKSVNTAGFVLAVLLQEGVVGGRGDGKGRGYILVNMAAVSGNAESAPKPRSKGKARPPREQAPRDPD